MTATLNLEHRVGRCEMGFDIKTQHPGLCGCRDGSEWSVFVAAVTQVVRPDRTVHQSDMRPLLRGRVSPKSIGSLYRRAKADGLLVDTGEREPSDDVAGRNTDKLDRIYRSAA